MDPNRRLFLLAGIVVVVALLVFGGYRLMAGDGGPTYKLTVTSIPNDLTLTLDGHEIPANGTVEVKAGRHALTGERRGFENHTRQIDLRGDLDVKMYLFAKDAEGRAWEQSNPTEALQREAEAGRMHDEKVARQIARYPILAQLPYVGPGYTLYGGPTKNPDPDDPEKLAFYVQLRVPEAKVKPQLFSYLRSNDVDPAQLELIYLPAKK